MGDTPPNLPGDQDIHTPPDLAGAAYVTAVRAKAANLKAELIDQTLRDTDSWVKAIDTQWATAHPGQDLGQRPPITPTEKADFEGRVRNEYYEWVVPAFERRLNPDPDATNPMIQALGAIENTLQGSTDDTGKFTPTSPALSRITDALIDIDHWEGRLQENFTANFLSPLQNVAHNEGTVAKAARTLLLLNKVHYIRYRKAVLTLLDTSIEAVKVLDNQRDPKPYLWGSIVVISIGTVLSAGSGAVLAIGTGLAVAGTILGGLIPDPPKTVDLAAPTAQEVAVNVSNALAKLDQDTYDNGEADLERGFRDMYATISGLHSRAVAGNVAGAPSVARPALENAPAADVLGGAFVPGAR